MHPRVADKDFKEEMSCEPGLTFLHKNSLYRQSMGKAIKDKSTL